MTRTRTNMLQALPFLAGVMPLVAMFGALWLGIANGVLPDCNPLIDGCRSISATGRQPPGSFLFRIIMLPQAVLLWFVWYFATRWLVLVLPETGRATMRTILIAGFVNAFGLAVYVTFLGTSEPIYEFMRRYGIYFTYLGGAVAQIAIAIALLRSSFDRIAKIMLAMCASVFVLGILNLVLKAVLDDADAAENRIEWLATILIQLWFLVLWRCWRSSGADFSVRVGPP